MASLFQGEAPPNVQTTRETTAVAPQYLTDYLTQLATQGQQTLGVKDPVTGVYTPPTQAQLTTAGTPYVAPLSQLQKDVATNAPTDLYKAPEPTKPPLSWGIRLRWTLVALCAPIPPITAVS